MYRGRVRTMFGTRPRYIAGLQIAVHPYTGVLSSISFPFGVQAQFLPILSILLIFMLFLLQKQKKGCSIFGENSFYGK